MIFGNLMNRQQGMFPPRPDMNQSMMQQPMQQQGMMQNPAHQNAVDMISNNKKQVANLGKEGFKTLLSGLFSPSQIPQQQAPQQQVQQQQPSFQPTADPMQGWSQIANAAVNNTSQANKIKLGSLFGLGGNGLY